MKDFFHRDLRLFIDHRFDWERYFRLRGTSTEVAEEVETYRTILRTAGEVCGDIEAAARDHWHEEVRLDGSAVVVPPHIVTGYEKLRAAGLLCLMVDPAYGGYGLPALVNCVFMEMLSRADPSLMTIVGLQAGVALDVQKYGSEELKRRYLPRFVSGELQGCRRRDRISAASSRGSARKTAATSSTAARSSSRTAAPTCTSCWRATARHSTNRAARPTVSAWRSAP